MRLGHPVLAGLCGLLGAVLVGACSVGPSPGSGTGGNFPAPGQPAPAPVAAQATTAVDPCALVTKADADAAFGFSFDPGTVETSGGSKSCTYVHDATSLIVAVTLQPSSKSVLETTKSIYGARATGIEGVGDGAFQVDRTITVLKGSVLFMLGTGAGPGIISDERLRDLAKTAAGRL